MNSSLVRSKYFKLVAVFVLGLAIVLPLTLSKQSNPIAGNAQTAPSLYVSTSGSDSNLGTSQTAPLRTIQAALNKATPGYTINIAPGIYRERLTTMRAGTIDAPITLKGPELGKNKSGRYQVVLHGTGRIVNVNHSHYVFEGFTIDGNEKMKNATYPTTLSTVKSFKDNNQGNIIDSKLIYIGSADTTRDITGVTIRNMFLHGAGTECIRMRNNAMKNVVEDSVIEWCGMYGGGSSDQYTYHNGEGVYIGTSPKSTSQPMYANDGSSFNIIRNNTIYTFGSECFEVKENAHDNTFEGNDCRYNDEPYSELGSNIELRGYNNKISNNTIKGSRSIGLKMKSDSTSYMQGGNIAQNNAFSEITNESIRNDQSKPQGLFCGNTFTGTILVGTSVGNPTAACPLPTGAPTPTTVLPTNTPTPTVALPSATTIPTATPTVANPTPTIQAGTSMTFTSRVALSSDDAEETVSTTAVNTISSALQLITDSGRAQQVGMRFQKVTIPRGATITNAYLEFTAEYGSSDATSLVIFGEYTANSQTFTTTNKNISGRLKTGASVRWTAIPSWVNLGKYKSPNLATIVQEVTTHPTWASGNSMSFIVTGSGKRVAKSFNGSSTSAPRLVITYTN